MKALRRLSVLFVISLMLFSASVFAAGGGGGGSSGGSSGGGSRTTADTQAVTVVQKVNCETRSTLSDRVQCRLENKNNLEATNYAEEACRNHNKEKECVELYKVSEVCYELTGIEKHRCFISRSGIDENRNLSASTQDSKRNYVILLLYDLQEKIEDRQANGQMSTEKATELVSKIIEIKRDILTNKPKSEIRTKMQELKSLYSS